MVVPGPRFSDGVAYERGMGRWSPIAGGSFLDWLAPRPGLRWIDVGCGTGAFTELVMQRCAPAAMNGVDPSEPQLTFARTRAGARGATFQQGDAMALPFPADSFDAATMALVIFFVPDPARGVAEMARVVAPGGSVAAYAWDYDGNGSPTEPVLAELRARGVAISPPPRADAARKDAMRALWAGAGLTDVDVRAISPRRTFADFDEFWDACLTTNTVGAALAGMAPGDVARVRDKVRARMPADADGRVSYVARANAVKGRVPT